MGNQNSKEVQLRDGKKISDLVNAEEGLISPRIFTDPEIYELEMERIFAKSWNFVAHVTEIPNKGDYVTRYVGNDRVIVTRAEDDKINVFLNVCMHKGIHLCRTDGGNTKNFRCIYHGWTYNMEGTVIGAPAAKEAYKGLFDKNKYQLTQARVGTYAGLVFATFNDDAPSLNDWLGDAKFYLDCYFDRTPKGMEVIGEPMRWVFKANWKSAADNFASDSYHTLMTHYSGVALGLLPPDPMFASHGTQIALENGHGVGVVGAPPKIPLPQYLNLPSMNLRVRKMETEYDWAEDPASRTRRFVTNVRVWEQEDGKLEVKSYMQVVRSRLDAVDYQFLSIERCDLLDRTEGIHQLECPLKYALA